MIKKIPQLTWSRKFREIVSNHKEGDAVEIIKEFWAYCDKEDCECWKRWEEKNKS